MNWVGSLQIKKVGYQTGTTPIKSGPFKHISVIEGYAGVIPSLWFQCRPVRISCDWSAWSQHHLCAHWNLRVQIGKTKVFQTLGTFCFWTTPNLNSLKHPKFPALEDQEFYVPDLPKLGLQPSLLVTGPWPLHTAKVDWSPRFVLQAPWVHVAKPLRSMHGKWVENGWFP